MPELAADAPVSAPPTAPGVPGCLVHVYPAGPEVGTRYPLGDHPVYVGRGDDCAVRNLDGSVSRHHAQLARGVCGGHVVLDLGSTNGTYVNNHRRQLATLADGDYLRIGNCVYRYFSGPGIEARYREEMYRLTILDGLTLAHNRRSLVSFLDTELAQGRPLAVVMFDLDHFQSINAALGQLAGDVLLVDLADLVRPWARPEDLFARFGGEEFVVALVDTPADEAVAAAGRLRRAIADHEFRFEAKAVNLTVSVGVAATPGGTAELLRVAEDRVREAKRIGRNCVVGPATAAT